MNIVLNSPIRTISHRRNHDNKILFIFLSLIILLIGLGLVFINVTKNISNSSKINTEEQVEIKYSEVYT